MTSTAGVSGHAVMTPLQIKMVLHYYAIAAPYSEDDPDHANSPAVTEQRGRLLSADLLVYDARSPSGYSVTPRGNAYVQALCAIQLPIQKWVMP